MLYIFFLQDDSFLAFGLFSIIAVFTEPVQELRMESCGEKCQTYFSQQLLSCPVLDGVQLLFRCSFSQQVKGREFETQCFPRMRNKTKKAKQENTQLNSMIYNHLKYVNKTHVVGRINTLYRVVMKGFFEKTEITGG